MNAEDTLCRPGGFHMTKELFEMAGLFGRKEPVRAADIGCGAGASIAYLRRLHPSWDIRGIDPDPKMRQDKTVDTGKAKSLPFPASSLDAVLMECSLSKTGDPDQALRESLRVLKPDGWLLLSDLYARKKETGTIFSAKGPYPGRLEYAKTIVSRLRRAGFSIIEMQDRSSELIQWIGQKLLNGEAKALFGDSDRDRERLKEAGCGYYICAAKPSALWETLCYAGEKSPFYRERLSEIPGAGDWTAFLNLPFTTPEDVKNAPESFLCVNPKEIARIITISTSGTGGKPKRLYFTEADLLRTADFFEKGMQYLVKPGDRVMVYMEGPGRFTVGGLLKEALGRIHIEVTVHGLIRDMEAAAAAAKGHTCLVGTPGQMRALAASAPGLRPQTVLLSADYIPESVKSYLETIWDCNVFAHWGMTETGYGGGVQCKSREGYHLRDGDLLLEIIDPATGLPVPDGQYGEITVTAMHREGMPLIRYRTGDLGRLTDKPCGCGCLKPRLDNIRGRLGDSIRLKNGSCLSMHILDELLFGMEGLQDFTAGFDKDRELLTIEVMRQKGYQGELCGGVKTRLRENYGDSLRIEAREKELSPYIGSGKRRLKEAVTPTKHLTPKPSRAYDDHICQIFKHIP